MAGSIQGRNKRAQASAKKAGNGVFNKEIIEYWPSCTECGQTLRHRGMSNFRTCGCPKKKWVCISTGWKEKE